MYYVYFLRNASNKVYVGYTNDLRRRIEEHNSGRGGKYTKHKGLFKLVYYEAYRSEKDAKRREENLKLHKKAYAQLRGRISESLIM